MKKLSMLFVLLCSLPLFAANTCTFPPQSINTSHNVSCSLPALSANQCVQYRFHWSESGSVSGLSVNVKLNSSVVYPDVSFTDGGNYELVGRFCASDTTHQYFYNSPVFEYAYSPETFFILEGSTWGNATEDLTVSSTLTFNVIGGRGLAAYLNGGDVEIK